MTCTHEFVNVSAGLGEDKIPSGVYDLIQTEVHIDEEENVTFVHRIGLKYRPPKVVEVNPAGESNTPGE